MSTASPTLVAAETGMLTNMPPNRYTRTAMVLHWLVALLILSNVILIYLVEYVPDERVRWVIDTHKSTGITVLGLAILRLLWRFAHKPPELPGSYARWERRASSVAHGLLYSLIFIIPLSGWLHDSAWKNAAAFPLKLYGLVPWPRIGWIMEMDPATRLQLHGAFGALHEYAGYVLFALLALHIAGALKHQFVDKQKQLQRMWS